MRLTKEYDAIIVGASVAGLAVARQLRGRVLLVDRREVGEVQTSACGTPLWVMHALGLERSVLQVHHRAVVHTSTGTVVYELEEFPYCTFDYRRFCRGLLEQTGARFIRSPVTGFRDGRVETEAGQFGAHCVIECSGWRGVLRDGADAAVRASMSFGLETRTDYPGEALYFWAAPVKPGLVDRSPLGGRNVTRHARDHLRVRWDKSRADQVRLPPQGKGHLGSRTPTRNVHCLATGYDASSGSVVGG